ncbi:MAG: hypothetical protein WCS87_20380 [Methylococcaceae bacterium]
MNLSAQDITAEILTLPEQEQQEVADFTEFLKTKLARQQAKRFESCQQTLSNQLTEGARVLQVLEDVGLLGCMEGGDGKLSDDYKQHLWGNE